MIIPGGLHRSRPDCEDLFPPSDGRTALTQLRELLDQDWDDSDRISVVINPPPTPRSRSIFPPQLDPKSPIARWTMTLILALAAIGGAVRMIADLLR